MSGNVADGDEIEGLREAIDRSRRAERVGWAAIAVVVALGVGAVLAVLAGVLLFAVMAVGVID
ncbi:hypothetical protein [Streptomyces sp. NPDC126503]|uniref:hypothetical protein n=1 Tax=Streptomyces sp. NPDC126503 TaxID=3155315 RepID=UPI00332ABD44